MTLNAATMLGQAKNIFQAEIVTANTGGFSDRWRLFNTDNMTNKTTKQGGYISRASADMEYFIVFLRR